MKNSFSKTDLDIYETFYIETTRNEKFEITKLGPGYLLKDITPPVLEKEIQSFCTQKINKKDYKKLDNNPKYEFLNVGSHFVVDGIVKGGHFGFTVDQEEGTTITKGVIDKLYIKVSLGEVSFNIHLFDPPGKKLPVYPLIEGSFSITTDSVIYSFIKKGEGLFFEDRKVIAIYSSINAKQTLGELLDKDNDVTKDFIVYNRPFVIITGEPKDDKTRVNLTYVNEYVLDINVPENITLN